MGVHHVKRYPAFQILVFCFAFLTYLTHAQNKQATLKTGLYKRVDFSSFKFIDTVFRDTLYLDSVPICSVSDFKEVTAEVEEFSGQPVMEIRLSKAGTEKFAKVTRESIAKKIAIIGNGKLLAAPVVTSEITGGRLMVSGNFTFEEINALVNRIRKDIPGNAMRSVLDLEQEKQINKACGRLDSALIHGDTVKLNDLLHRKLSLGHSNGLIENKEDLLLHLSNGYVKYNSITEEDYPEIQFATGVATVRRELKVKGELDHQLFDVNLEVLEVWIAENKEWKLLCRQSVKLH